MTSTADVLAALPDRFGALWPHQQDAVTEILQQYECGADVVVLDAPTGSGKTLIAEVVRQCLSLRGVYIATTKTLQEQFARDFPYAAVLMGRENYPTMQEELFHDNDDAFRVTAADCTKQTDGGVKSCEWCDPISLCPYEQAKHTALGANVAVLNTAYFLTECNGPGRFSGRDFTVCDEADLLESEIMRYEELAISARRVKQLGLGEPKYVTKKDSWADWCGRSITRVEERVVEEQRRVSDKPNLHALRERRYLARLYDSLRELYQGLISEETEWIYTGKNGAVTFKPVSVAKPASTLLWKHSSKWLLMSATIISPSTMLQQDLGFSGNWSFVSVPSTFPTTNRPVKFTPFANVTKENKETEYARVAKGLEAVIARHPGERVLVHTVSYDLASVLTKSLASCNQDEGRTRGGIATIGYSTAAERNKAIRGFTSTDNSCRGRAGNRDTGTEQSTGVRVLLAPSLDRGIDLPDDQCRVIVIAKVPYPNLGDRQISARLHQYGGQTWYLVQTIRSIIQMSGRGMRHKDDHCVTYILDRQFLRVWNQGRRLFPSWFTDALVWNDRLEA